MSALDNAMEVVVLLAEYLTEFVSQTKWKMNI